ncbi:hypothetical protein [Halorussus halobius]|uniref:hypothetical protein n=1 Tax=Halorussus halobius TaxID=1710537 RepID=UPI0010929A23|nr:hypothetical protein [Halorussus halobius]
MGEIAPWTLETDAGDVRADFLDGQLFNTQPGGEIEARFVFVLDGVDETPSERHGQLQSLVDAAVDGTTIRTGRTRRGRPYYREVLSGFPDVDSLLVAMVPDEGRGGVWAVLRSGADATPSVERDVFVWEFEATVLTRYEEGDSREDIEAAYRDEVRA